MAAMPIGVVIVKFLDRWRVVYFHDFRGFTLETVYSTLV